MRGNADQRSESLSLVYIAGNRADAAKAEHILAEHGVAYTLNLEPFVSASLVRTGVHAGLFVYVPTALHHSCREILEQNGLTDTVDLDSLLPESQ